MRRVALLVLFALLLLTIAGAWWLSFLCDDAYITFRYVSNARDGHGLVWNPAPFLPVEGYTGFLWALLLWATWSWFGVEPPDAANVLSVAFGVAQFAVVAYAALRLRRRDGSRIGDGLALATVACVVGQRTFLQWMTSGLETALFNLGFVSWALLAFVARERRDTRWLVLWSASAAVAALTRPDGLLLVAATGATALPALAAGERRMARAAAGLSPLLAVVAHVAWRRWFYGEWLPNTYYAKVVKPWPEAGILYWKCFLFEHGLWLWFPVAAAWGVAWLVRHRKDMPRSLWRCLPACAVLGAIAFHAGYYVLKVGGDHFEYRVLSQLVPLAWLSLAAMGVWLGARTGALLALLGVVFVFSGAGWLHLAISTDMPWRGAWPLTHRVPALLQPYWRCHDSRQILLHIHYVGLRCNQHAAARELLHAQFPARACFNRDPSDLPVLVHTVAGVAGWVLPDCAVLDALGLNDWVIARNPVPPSQADGLALVERTLLAADSDRDGWWGREELRSWLQTFVPIDVGGSGPEPLIDMALDLFAARRRDALAQDEVAGFLRGVFSRGAIGHERVSPPGYVDAFEPNVVVTPAGVSVTPRAVPLRPRIRGIEAEWRRRVGGDR